LMAASGRL